MSDDADAPTPDRGSRFEEIRKAVALALMRKGSMEAFSGYAAAGGSNRFEHMEMRDHFRSEWVKESAWAERLMDALAAEPGLTRPELEDLAALAEQLLYYDLVLALRERLAALP
jgi:hypothetical protein